MSENSSELLNTKIAQLENELAKFKKEGKAREKKLNQLENDVKRLKKRQDYVKSENYRDYYFDPNTQNQIIKRLAETIDQEGTILELKAIDDFSHFGYNTAEHFYVDVTTGKTRQLDIVATKQSSFTIDKTETKITLRLWIVADCKYKSQIDLLCFDVGINPKEVLQFPIFIAADYRFGLDRVLDQNLLITSKITQLVIDAGAMKGEHLSDGMIYDASLQVYDGISSLYREQYKPYSDHMKLELERGFNLKRAAELVELESFYINDDEMMSRLHMNSAYDLFIGVERIYLDAFVPVIIFDENRGILKAGMDSDFRLKNLEDIEIVLYEFSKGYLLDQRDLLTDYIFLVNRNGIRKLFNYLELYLDGFEERFLQLFENHPKTIITLFTDAVKDKSTIG